MIKSFNHKGLSQLFYKDSKKGINPNHYAKLKIILTALDTAWKLEQLNMPGFDLHSLSGNLREHHSITVNGNWRVIFIFNTELAEVYVVDYIDYH